MLAWPVVRRAKQRILIFPRAQVGNLWGNWPARLSLSILILVEKKLLFLSRLKKNQGLCCSGAAKITRLCTRLFILGFGRAARSSSYCFLQVAKFSNKIIPDLKRIIRIIIACISANFIDRKEKKGSVRKEGSSIVGFFPLGFFLGVSQIQSTI